MRRLIDAANRSAVVIYTIDPRGLQVYSLTAADDTRGMSAQQLSDVASQRATAAFESGQGMAMLAEETGGLFIHNNNDIDGALRRVLADSENYYLIGYRPDPRTFETKNGRLAFHRLHVQVRRPGLRIRSPTGFFGIADREQRQQSLPRTREARLARAVASPFASDAVHVRLTTLFWNSATLGSFLDSMLHVDARDLKFTTEPDGSHRTEFDVAAITFGDNGQVAETNARSYTVRVRDDEYPQMQATGLIFAVRHRISRPGAYQVRAALRDQASDDVGSAAQFIEVPDLKKRRLALSSILLQSGAAEINAAGAGQTEGRLAEHDPSRDRAVRAFKPGSALKYFCQVYNARTDSANRGGLQAQMRLFRDGQQVFAGKPTPIDITGQTDLTRLLLVGKVQLDQQMKPGDYLLQLTVTDNLAKEKYRTASQWMDFEVEP